MKGNWATVNEYVAKRQDANLHSLHPCHLNIFGFCLVVSDIIRIFDVVVGTLARNNKEKWIFLWFFAHLFVSLPQKDAGLVLNLLRFLEVHVKLETI